MRFQRLFCAVLAISIVAGGVAIGLGVAVNIEESR